ncbi:MAG: 6-bladed beta-propeller [Gemmatimonadetes bacterium]|nr:6-bladed beta-propeller [Gemmatimonadota bacterium]
MSARAAGLWALLVLVGACDLLRRSDDGLDEAVCASCRIAATPVLQLDFTGAPSLPDMATTVALDANHLTFAVVASQARTEFMLFDADGRFLRTIGTGGDGPDEYARIDDLAFDATDSLWVFDGGNARADVFGPDFVRVRSVPLVGRFRGVVALHDGSFAVPGGGATVEGVSFQARRLWRDGTTEPFAPAASDRALGEDVVLAHGGRDEIWLTPARVYSIETWTLDGSHLQTLERLPPWFVSVDPARLAAFQGLMDVRPAILDLAGDAAGHVWVIGGVLDPDAPDPATSAGRTDVNIDEWFDTVIEVVDHGTGKPVISDRFDFAPPAWLRDGIVARFVIDIMGTPGIEIMRLDLHEF